MVYQYLTFEEMNQLMKHQIMSSSSSSGSDLSSCNVSHVPSTTSANRPQSLSENNLLVQCMQKLGQYPASSNPRVVLQESNGQIVGRSSTKGEGGDDQPAAGGGGGCTPRPRWCPTPEQIQVLETLFNSGTTTPSRDMIVEIAACLKQFGSIVEANVFYWFQNRKARAKRKLRMQAQLQQQQSASAARPTDADQPQSAPPQLSHNVLNAPPTSRRVCAKTASKTSPSAFAVSDHQLPPLIHLPASVNHADHHTGATCSLMTMHDSNHDQHATAASNMIMPQPLYAAGDCNTSLQLINTASGCDVICSSNAELPLYDAGCTTIRKKQSFGEHALHQGMSQAMPSQIISHAPAPPPSNHEHTDHHYNIIQNHIDCDQYVDNISSYSTARTSSRPRSADGNNVMISGCSVHSAPPESAAAQSTVSINSHLYHAAAADFDERASQNHKELSAARHYNYGDNYTGTPAAYASIPTSTSSYPEQVGSLSLSLPNKRSWMEALMQHFVLSQDSSCNTSSTTTNITQNMYNDVDHYTPRVHPNELLNNLIHSNLLLQQPQLLNPSQDAPIIYTTPTITNLSKDALEPTHSNISTIKEANDGTDTKQASSPSHAPYNHIELHDAITTKRERSILEPLMSCNSTLATSQQQQATNPPIFHHCDHLPLWEALAPYMSIGS